MTFTAFQALWASKAGSGTGNNGGGDDCGNPCGTGNDNTDADTARQGTGCTVSYDVKYGQTEARSMLSMINSFRTGSDAWYWNSSNSERVSSENLQPLDYDYDLEKTAMARAAEIALYYSHTRPDGSDPFTAYSGYRSAGENIAIGYGSADLVFRAWREDNEQYSGQGHRRNMLSSSNTAVAIGHVEVNGTHCWVQEFRSPTGSTYMTPAEDSRRIVSVAVDPEYLGNINFRSKTTSLGLKAGESKKIPDIVVEVQNKRYSYHKTYLSGITPEMSVKDPSIADVSGDMVVGKESGTTKLVYTVTICGEIYDATLPVTVTGGLSSSNGNGENNNKTSDKVTVGGIKYKLSSNGEASVTGAANSYNAAITIPGYITTDGNTYFVTGISSEAFKKNTVKKISGGINLRTIGEKAFVKCRGLTDVDMASSQISSIGKKAFKGCSSLTKIGLNAGALSSIGKNAFKTGGSNTVRVTLSGSSGDVSRVRSMMSTAGLSRAVYNGGTSEPDVKMPSADNTPSGNTGDNKGNDTGNTVHQTNGGFTLKTGWYKDPTTTMQEYMRHDGSRLTRGQDGDLIEYVMVDMNHYKYVYPSGRYEEITVTSDSSFERIYRDENGDKLLRFNYKFRGTSLW